MSMIPKCDFCGHDTNDNNFSLEGAVYGIMGENSSPDFKMTINKRPSEDDDVHICHSCLRKLCEEFKSLNS